jgi:DNA-directed RNA polymerase subunit RPC12/RpoP
MSQSFKCQNKNCGLQVPAKDANNHLVTGDRYYTCPSCGAKNKVIQQPTPQGAPIEFIPSGIIE